MTQPDIPVTTAVRALREHNIPFTPHFYTYEEHGGTRHSAQALGVPEHMVVKTLVFITDRKQPFLALMHGDREVSTKELARVINVKRVEVCDEKTAHRTTGYLFGGTSPFGTRTRLPVYAEKTIFELGKIFINGGKRGFLVEIHPEVLKKMLLVVEVDVAIIQKK
jgi:Cys-tRNA(Pro) deacylase